MIFIAVFPHYFHCCECRLFYVQYWYSVFGGDENFSVSIFLFFSLFCAHVVWHRKVLVSKKIKFSRSKTLWAWKSEIARFRTILVYMKYEHDYTATFILMSIIYLFNMCGTHVEGLVLFLSMIGRNFEVNLFGQKCRFHRAAVSCILCLEIAMSIFSRARNRWLLKLRCGMRGQFFQFLDHL